MIDGRYWVNTLYSTLTRAEDRGREGLKWLDLRTDGWFLLLFPAIIVVYGYNNGEYDLNELFHNEAIPVWLLWLGIVAQVVFTFRFIYQWMYSEKTKTSQLPIGFWRLSVLGAGLILTYAILRLDPVLFIGHGAGMIIYIRNIFIGKKERHETA